MGRSQLSERVVPDLSHDLHVSVASPEEAESGVAEFWVGDHLFGSTRLEEGEPVLRIEPRSDGGEIAVTAQSLAAALAQAKLLLEPS